MGFNSAFKGLMLFYVYRQYVWRSNGRRPWTDRCCCIEKSSSGRRDAWTKWQCRGSE